MKLFALLLLSLLVPFILVSSAGAQATFQNCTPESQQSPECCEARELQHDPKANDDGQENCDQRLDIVKVIMPIIGIVLLAGGIVGAVVWERRRLG